MTMSAMHIVSLFPKSAEFIIKKQIYIFFRFEVAGTNVGNDCLVRQFKSLASDTKHSSKVVITDT